MRLRACSMCTRTRGTQPGFSRPCQAGIPGSCRLPVSRRPPGALGAAGERAPARLQHVHPHLWHTARIQQALPGWHPWQLQTACQHQESLLKQQDSGIPVLLPSSRGALWQQAAASAAAPPACAAVQVEALLNTVEGARPAIAWIVAQLEALGYCSWAHRVVNTAGAAPFQACACFAAGAHRLPAERQARMQPPASAAGAGLLCLGPQMTLRCRSMLQAQAGHRSKRSSQHNRTEHLQPNGLESAGHALPRFSATNELPRCAAAFGLPNRRRRVFLVASLHGDARDVLLSQVCRLNSSQPPLGGAACRCAAWAGGVPCTCS